MKNTDKKPTSEEIERVLKGPLPDNKKKLTELHERVRRNMHRGHAETQSYKQKLDFLRSIEFKLQWMNAREANRKMFYATIIIAIFSLSVSFGIYRENIKSNQISLQPVLAFKAEYEEPFRFENGGNGPALNIILLHGNINKELFISKEEDVISVLVANKEGSMKREKMIKTDLEEIQEKIPWAYDYIKVLIDKNYNWFCLIYEDLYSNRFVSTIKGVGGEYSEAMDYKKF